MWKWKVLLSKKDQWEVGNYRQLGDLGKLKNIHPAAVSLNNWLFA